MENTKAKTIIFIVIIILLLACVGVIVCQQIKIDKIKKVSDNVITDDITEKVPDNVVTNVTTEKVTQPLVEDQINYYEPKFAKSECYEDKYLYLKVRLPKINIDNEQVAKVNREIVTKFDTTKSAIKLGDEEVNYTYKVIPEKNILLVNITYWTISHCATGGSSTENYIYDLINNKFLTKEQLLSLYDISIEDLKASAQAKLEMQYADSKDEYSEHLNAANNIIDSMQFNFINIDTYGVEVFLPVDLEGIFVGM